MTIRRVRRSAETTEPAFEGVPPGSSGFSYVAGQATNLGAIALAVALAGGAYLAADHLWGSLGAGFVAVPVLYAVAVLGAALCVFLLTLRARIGADPVASWLAAGFGVAGFAALAQGLAVAKLGSVPLTPTSTGAAALYLIWHGALPLFTVGAIVAAERTWLRRVTTALFTATVAAALWGPPALPLPELVDASDRFTPSYRLSLTSLLVATVAATVLWAYHAGRRPSRLEAWILVALILSTLDVVVASSAERFFEAIWWSSAALRAATFAVPAVGLLSEAGRMLQRLHHHERSLVDRLQREMAIAADSVQPVAPDPGARARIEAVLERPGAITTVYQPIYSLATGDLAAVEALARFSDAPTRSPDRWFAEAHAVELGVELELAAIAAALDGADRLPHTVPLTVNSSPELLVSGGLDRLLDAHPDRRLVVEITEHARVDDYNELGTSITALRERGIRLAIDDAGAGFASMRHIIRLVPDIIKLDMSLTRDIHLDPVRRSLATSLVSFAEQIGALLVAEGVEDIEELTTWQQLGAHAAQGYLLARPGPLPAAPRSPVVPAPRVAVAHPPAHDAELRGEDRSADRSGPTPGAMQ